MRISLLCFLLLTSIFMFGQTGQSCHEGKLAIRWGLAPSFHINIPGDWKSTKSANNSYGYGGGVGLLCNLRNGHDFFVEAGISINCDELKLYAIDKETEEQNLTRWCASIPLTCGYQFCIGDELNISPLIGFDLSYSLSGKYRREDLCVKPFNLSGGIGVGLQRDLISIDLMGYFGLLKTIDIGNSAQKNDNKVCITVKYLFTHE